MFGPPRHGQRSSSVRVDATVDAWRRPSGLTAHPDRHGVDRCLRGCLRSRPASSCTSTTRSRTSRPRLPVATDIRAPYRSARRCCSRWSPSRPPGRAMPRPMGDRVPYRVRPVRDAAQPGLPRRSCRPVHPQLRLVHVQRLVHRLHPGRSPEAGDRRAALPARVPVAFDAWMATDPLHNPRAAPGPTYMPEYKLADQAKADALDREAEAASAAGDHAAVVGDEYIRITVFLAAVLFLVGIGSTFKLPNVRYALITVGAVLLIVATVLIVRQPGIPA